MTHYDHPARIMAAEAQITSLKAALREALDGWYDATSALTRKGKFHQQQRITALRKFLDDK